MKLIFLDYPKILKLFTWKKTTKKQGYNIFIVTIGREY